VNMAELARSERLRAFYGRWLPWGLAVVAAVNLVLTFLAPASSRPIRLHESGSLTSLVHAEQRSVDHRYGFYLELDDATTGGVLVAPPGSFPNPELVQGLAGMDLVETDYDPTAISTTIQPGPALGEIETDQGDIPYSIVEGGGETWWLAFRDGEWIVVPTEAQPVPG
jgi:hypothetical protein